MKMTAKAPRLPARTPEELVDALERRSQRRVAGGLIALHHRGERSLGPLWKPLLGALGAVSTVIAWKVLTARRPVSGGVGESFASRCMRRAWLWRP
jgi:hypothetical protein